MAVETRRVDPDEEGMRLDRWFKTHFPDLSFGHLQKLLRSGQVRVDGGRVKTNSRLSAGQSIRIPPLEEKPQLSAADHLEAEERVARGEAPVRPARNGTPARGEGVVAPAVKRASADDKDAVALRQMTLYEDRDVLVLNKPYGLAVQGGSGTYRHVDGMLEALRGDDGQKPRLVHRIDKDTSGILLVAKSRLAASTLAKTFRSRSARKVYWALVPGVPRPSQGRISTYLAKDEAAERMRVARHGDDEASHAISYYAVVDHAAQKLSWLSLKPVTGRTHQLRAHAAHIGHPIVGDPKYFNVENWPLPGGLQNRLHLLARRLVIPHPRADRLIDVSAPLPPHMQQSWNVLGFDASQYDPIVEAPES
ncbi:Ribosomal large subunit pseudouridine synthase C [Starkeya nomas]|uniref:Ribosomal large subunit pseudouridine synthase C n=2 Tax=Xanthobacteraceae TaxID=335928 RepID=A0A5S9NRA8_9HYPH|nr:MULTISPECIES: RluA family pseudouridine synthase [Xanthobacteraceae]TSJ61318.1 RluA family pseudouridine synthase [Ancylobacter moscoviensis]CAA0093096.1 Ribosomal large subunit pseudouridine synthase C [Starkeya nomas]